MKRDAAEIRAEIGRWKARQLECRFLSRASRNKSDRTNHSIEAAYAAIIVGALSYAVGDAPTAATRIKVE